MRKFELTVGNPPYTKGLDIDIHKSFSKISKRIVFVHPSTFLISHKGKAFEKQMKRIDCSKIESAHLLWGNAMFNIQLYVPIVVSTWDAGKKDGTIEVRDDAYTYSTYVCNYDKVHPYGKDYPRFLEWVNQNIMPLVEKNGSVGSHGEKLVDKEFGIRLSTIRGHPPLKDGESNMRSDFYTILPCSDKAVKDNFCVKGATDKHHDRMFSFDTEEERLNFIKYLKTKSVRFVLSIFKFSQMLYRGEMKCIPWMDFKTAYYDSDLRKLWNIDDSLWEFIDRKIPDYYLDYSYHTPFTNGN